jgi:hypothetical protein
VTLEQCAFRVQGAERCPNAGRWRMPGIGDVRISAARWCDEHRHDGDEIADLETFHVEEPAPAAPPAIDDDIPF